LLALDAHGVPVRLSLADYYGRLGAIDSATGRRREAAQNWRRASAIYEELDREGHLQASDVRSDAEKARMEAARLSEGAAHVSKRLTQTGSPVGIR
jgi:hypothetical protein